MSCWGQGAFWKTPGKTVVSYPQLWKARFLRFTVRPGTGLWVGLDVGSPLQFGLQLLCPSAAEPQREGREEPTGRRPADPTSGWLGTGLRGSEVSSVVGFARPGANPSPAMNLTLRSWASHTALHPRFPGCEMGKEDLVSEVLLRADVLRSGVQGRACVCMCVCTHVCVMKVR